MGVSAMQYSWKSASGSTAFTCSDAALMIPLFHACGTVSTPCRAGELGDAQHLGDAAAARDVGLDEVDVAALDQLAEAPERRVLLAGGDADVDRVGELGVGLVLVGQERLLEPEDAELLERRARRGSPSSASAT